MSEEGERRIPDTLEEDSETEEVPTTTGDSEKPTVHLPLPQDSLGRFTRRSPAPEPIPPPLASTPTPPRAQSPPSFQLSATTLSYLSRPTRQLFSDPKMSQTGEVSPGPHPNSTDTNPLDAKGKRPANTNQHTNSSKCSYTPSYKLSSIPKLSSSEN